MVRLKVRDLNRQVIFQTLVKVADGFGGFTETWTDSAPVWAKMEPYRSSETYDQGVDVNKIAYNLYCRFEDFTPGINMRVVYVIDGVSNNYQIGGGYELDDERKFYKVPLIVAKNG